MSQNTRKVHNPKSYAPAVFIPCWLIQVPSKLLSYAAKVLYGRLTQWSNERGDVFRSYNQLAQEIGASKRSVNEYLRELREAGLIDTLHPQPGGLNHFIFYDHPWMHEQINEFLCYKSQPDPEQDSALPRAGFCSTPEQDSASINIKEIKRNKKDIKPLVDFDKSTAQSRVRKNDISVYSENDLFMLFYNNYPNKQKPREAYKAFLKLNPDENMVSEIVSDVRARTNANWKNRTKDKIPHPATYLNGREWEGDVYQRHDLQIRSEGSDMLDRILRN